MTPDEHETATMAAADEYHRQCRRVFHATSTHATLHGRESLPADLVIVMDAAEDARDAWLRASAAWQAATQPPRP